MEGAARIATVLVSIASVVAAGCSRSSASDARPRGAALYASTCARCHGEAGGGGSAVGAAVAPRNFRDHAFQASRSDDDLRTAIANGTKSGMPPFGAVLDEAQIASLVGVLRGFDTAASASGGERR